MYSMRTVRGLAMTVALVGCLSAGAFAQLNLEGQSGILFNPVPFTLKSGTVQSGYRYVDADSLGNVQTQNLLYGWKGIVDVGYSRLNSTIDGVSDQNIFNAKWKFHDDKDAMAASSLWVLFRDLTDGGSDLTVGMNTAKVVMLGKMPLMVNLGARSSKARNAGLFGLASDRKLTWETSATLHVLPTVVLAAEWRQQVDTPTWSNVAIRWDFHPHFDVAVGLNNLGPGLNNQVGVGLTWKP